MAVAEGQRLRRVLPPRKSEGERVEEVVLQATIFGRNPKRSRRFEGQ